MLAEAQFDGHQPQVLMISMSINEVNGSGAHYLQVNMRRGRGGEERGKFYYPSAQ